jgi:RNA polymerase sigma-70 factor, ECF subfamily
MEMSYSMAWQNETPVSRAENDREIIDVYVQLSDMQLVELVLDGEETAFEKIFDRHKKLVAVIASRYFRRPEQIEEIVQISFAKAYFELNRFRGGHASSLASWLGRIATNSCLDILRSDRRKPEDLVADLSDVEGRSLSEIGVSRGKNAEKLIVERDLANKLLARLEPEDRAILQMLHVEGMSSAEIADITGWSVSRIKLRAWRARNALRKVVKKFL